MRQVIYYISFLLVRELTRLMFTNPQLLVIIFLPSGPRLMKMHNK